MTDLLSRRAILRRMLVAGSMAPALGLVGNKSRADTLTPLDASDPAAKALNFVVDASKIDARANSTYLPGQRCALCAHYRGKPTDTTAGCEIFAARSVPAGGWCLVWGLRAG